jgi:hypothetical protein
MKGRGQLLGPAERPVYRTFDDIYGGEVWINRPVASICHRSETLSLNQAE